MESLPVIFGNCQSVVGNVSIALIGVGAGSGLVGDVSVSEMVAADLRARARFGAMCLPFFFLMISRLYSQNIASTFQELCRGILISRNFRWISDGPSLAFDAAGEFGRLDARVSSIMFSERSFSLWIFGLILVSNRAHKRPG